MIDLVQQAARKVGRVELEQLAVAVERANGDARGAIDVPKISGIDRQPSSPFAEPSEDDLGFTITMGCSRRRCRDSLGTTDLRRGEADAFRRVHGLEHVVRQATELVGHALDGLRFLAKNRDPRTWMSRRDKERSLVAGARAGGW